MCRGYAPLHTWESWSDPFVTTNESIESAYSVAHKRRRELTCQDQKCLLCGKVRRRVIGKQDTILGIAAGPIAEGRK